MTVLLYVGGIVLFLVGLLLSIAWHELGHFSTARMFGIKVTQFMVGFGRTVWSTRRGETEWGIKAIPLGGYIRMIGMFPTSGGAAAGRAGAGLTRMPSTAWDFAEPVEPGDETKLFWTRAPWKRIIVMLAGPVMNLILAVVLFTVMLMGFGALNPTTTVETVTQCVPQATSSTTCPAGAPASPAQAAGLRAGDTIVSFQGKRVSDWPSLQTEIKAAKGSQVQLEVKRDGRLVPLTARIGSIAPAAGQAEVGFLGVSPTEAMVRQSPGAVVRQVGSYFGATVNAVAAIPERVPTIWGAAFEGKSRGVDSPVGVVGATRIGGQVLSAHIPISARIATLIGLLASINMTLFLVNLLPLLPLDGGHIVGALWESIRRHVSRVLRRPDPGPVNVAKALPLVYAVAAVLIGFTLLVAIADIVNPVRI
jgi:membrane-associated protease RseP (regulator of RpoE activity)